ncbi:inorganic phosphate transporter [Flavobacterium salilacus subsp. salilacus]|uniref:inorganic phosphate transporter n=1 Tax=Flavobacterium TaxID=237 RepID=UPI001074EDB0|nr:MULTISPECIES: inorganic phosphate transporter [Flavobacterium]KAF2519199.1 inorganic phosphate transporter [Flavobacterium salilacus subsp. salilacus]MBE1613379.1 inorganic phosphate transporter [Flavobacterium sp. SaA2.13]NDI98888.1 inorganic phosphate transporter [Flavobacterium salilacus subsp. altitudinum]
MTLLIIIIVLALVFDFINGFHDAANSIATIVATKVLTPFQAVLWAAFFNFLAYFISKYWIGEFKIGNTIAKTVSEDFITLEVILAGIIAAITWNLLTWKLGIPSSSSHTLIGGFMGAALAHAFTVDGADLATVVNYAKVIPIILFIFMAPLIGMIVAYFITVLILNICRKANPSRADKWFKRLQLVSSALFSLGHGANDAQKVMGIIGAAVIYYHTQIDPMIEYQTAADPFKYFVQHWGWVPLTSFVMIALGTMSGGWKIVKTMGTKITKVTSLEGVAAETAGAITLYTAEHFGIPVSTTHTITGSIIGVGITKRVSAVRWGVTISLLWAWILTIPVSAVIAALLYYIISIF